MKEKMKKRDVFYGVVAIATLIVAVIGATLAYFSITITSAEGAVSATAATINITYEDGEQVSMQADALIPSSFEVVQAAYAAAKESDSTSSNTCIDTNNEQVCSIYRFGIESDKQRDVTAKLNSDNNKFTYLYYAVYDVKNSTWLDINPEGSDAESKKMARLTKCDNDSEGEDIPKCYTETTVAEKTVRTYTNPSAGAASSTVNSIFGLAKEGSTTTFATKRLESDVKQQYDVVLFILENNLEQNEDQGATYTGSIYIEVVGETGRVTGEWSQN